MAYRTYITSQSLIHTKAVSKTLASNSTLETVQLAAAHKNMAQDGFAAIRTVSATTNLNITLQTYCAPASIQDQALHPLSLIGIMLMNFWCTAASPRQRSLQCRVSICKLRDYDVLYVFRQQWEESEIQRWLKADITTQQLLCSLQGMPVKVNQ